MRIQTFIASAVVCLVSLTSCSSHSGVTSSASDIAGASRQALETLYQTTPGARALGSRATGVLVFPNIVDAGFVFGAEFGEGALFEGGVPTAYYNTTAASFGFQAGVEKFGYALFFMSPQDLEYLKKSKGWELAALPSLTVMDKGVGGTLSTTASRSGIYAFFFEQRGLMGGISLQGAKITRIDPNA